MVLAVLTPISALKGEGVYGGGGDDEGDFSRAVVFSVL
jgi:hypothetical protein